MAIDLYNHIKSKPGFHIYSNENYLVLNYDHSLGLERKQFYTPSIILMYQVKGRLDWMASGESFQMYSGDTHFIKKGVYSVKENSGEEFSTLVFFINDEFINRLMLQHPELKLKTFSYSTSTIQTSGIELTEKLRSLFDSILNYINSGDEIPDNLLRSKIQEMLFEILKNSRNREFIKYVAEIRDHSSSNLEEIMLTNFQYDLKIEDFAKLTGRSITTFNRDFRRIFGSTPGRWIMAKKLHLAKSLLIGTNLNLQDVCHESGFRNTTQFNNAFRKNFKNTPGKFRKERVQL